jgi:uncharacterized protein (TIGR02145 family)
MKKSPFFIAFLLLVTNILFAQVGINTTGAPPDASAGLDVSFTNKGFLPPRVALTAINSALPVTAPAIGLLVYNTAAAGTAPYNVMAGYYCWDGTKWTPVATPPGTNPGEMQFWNGAQWVNIPAGSNGQVLTFYGIPIWQTRCGTSITVNHIAGAVAPVTKTVTYGTVTNIPGETAKCWITSNLGADHQATSVDDATEASAGWYWQFNRKQGYKHDGTTRTPNTTWIYPINESSDWTTANDPCVIEIGGGWRIPTNTEWTNVDASGSWINWNGPWNSGLKLHAAGYLGYSGGSLLDRGSGGYYWSSAQNDATNGWLLTFGSGGSGMNNYEKPHGFSVRCVRDY